MEPLVLLIFGKSGAGKSFVGGILHESHGWYVDHTDEDLTDEMIMALNMRKPFADNMRDRYFSIIAENILTLQESYQNIVLTQGAYKQRHRDYILNRVTDQEWVYIQSTDSLIQERLSRRQGGIYPASAAALMNDYEEPNKDTKVIVNNESKSSILRRLSAVAHEMPNKFSRQEAASLIKDIGLEREI